MIACFLSDKPASAVPITVLSADQYPTWLAQQPSFTRAWLLATRVTGEAGCVSLIPGQDGDIATVLCIGANQQSLWDTGNLPLTLPEGAYYLQEAGDQVQTYAIGWGLGAYQFTRYKQPKRYPAQLYLPAEYASFVTNTIESIYQVRDLINTPADDMGPTQFAHVAEMLAKQYGAVLTQLVGDELLDDGYAAIYTVGRASDDPPRLLDMRWGNASHPKLTLVGKGVCFDSGGLDIKPSSYMLLMKKDMAGGAHVLGLARMIMQAKLPVCLRVLIPVVENVISGNAYRPGDIIKSRKGLTIEVGNTDAEGRVILADALTEAASEKPDLLIDITTLTGAARVALGTELPAVFSNENKIVNELIQLGEQQNDPMWRLPLYALYRDYLTSAVADINNNASEPYAGAITAALFLKEFVPDDIPWLHFDMMAWNIRSRPGRPQGAEAMALRTLFAYLMQRWGNH